MSSFYDDASLVVIPSGYKTSKVYAEKPTDGSGDLAFTRTGDTATRVNSAGLIEKVRTNLALRSNTFNTTWTNVGSSETSGQAGYDGTTNAWSLIEDSSTGLHVLLQTIATTGLVTLSVYAKAGTRNWVYLRGVQSSANVRAWFNLSTGAIGTVEANGTAKIESVGNGWYRCSLTVANFQTGFESYIGVASADNASSYTGNGTGNVLIQNFQYETGDIATAYIPTTTAAVSVGPTANTARLDYLGSTCPRLLLEPQRTNLITFSEQLDNAAWTKTRSTITANNAVSPDGYTNADRITDTTFTANSSFVERQISSVIGTTYTFSAFLKAGTAPFMYVGLYDGANFNVIINASTGAISFTTAGATSTVTAYGNGWYRVSITRTITASASVYPYIGVCQLSNSITYNGTGAYTAQIWGAQYEASAYPTSYIPCLAASATRGADACSKTGISSLIGQTEGTLFYEFAALANESVTRSIGVTDGTVANRVNISVFATSLFARVDVGGVNQVNSSATIVPTAMNKVAFRYKANDFAAYVNGVKVITDTSGSTFSGTTLSSFAFIQPDSTSAFSGNVNQILFFKTALTDSELATLTTL